MNNIYILVGAKEYGVNTEQWTMRLAVLNIKRPAWIVCSDDDTTGFKCFDTVYF